MKRPTQRDLMQDLYVRLRGDHDQVVAAYAAAEHRGDVSRASNLRGMDAEEYARRLFRDGVNRGWLG